MKKYLYIAFFFICIISTSIPNAVYANNNTAISNQQNQIEAPVYNIYSTNKTIYITPLVSNSYVMIFDGTGRNVYKQFCKESLLSVPVYRQGMYIIRIQKGKSVFTQKVLVK